MFGLGIPELIVIFVIALVVFGPKKLPDLGKSIGRAMSEFKKAQEEFKESVQEEMREVEKTSGIDEIKKLGRLDDLSSGQGAHAKTPAEGPGAGPGGKTDRQPENDRKNGEANGNG